MMDIHRDPEPLRLTYFCLGLVATFAYRIIIVLNFFEPTWVKIAWYIGTIGFIIYFWSRYKIVKQFSVLINEEELAKAVKGAENISGNQKKALSYIVETLETTKAQLNYQMIFILSAIALLAGLFLDFII